MTLAASQNAALLCRAWCLDAAQPMQGCDTHAPGSALVHDCCDRAGSGEPAMLVKDTPQAPRSDIAGIPTPRYESATLNGCVHLNHHSPRSVSFEPQPSFSVLRI